MNIKKNINDYNLDDLSTCKNLAVCITAQNKLLSKDVNFYQSFSCK